MAIHKCLSLPLAATLVFHLFSSVFASSVDLLPRQAATVYFPVCHVVVDDLTMTSSFHNTDVIVADAAACQALCAQDSGCITYQTGQVLDDSGSISCALFHRSILDLNPMPDPEGLFTLNDVLCPTSYDPTSLVCASQTSDLRLSVLNSLPQGQVLNAKECADRCFYEPTCLSYQTSPADEYYILCFISALSTTEDGATPDSTSTLLLYDRECPVPSPTPVVYIPPAVPTCGVCARNDCNQKKRQEYNPGDLIPQNCQQRRDIQAYQGVSVSSNSDCLDFCQETFNCASYLISDNGDGTFSCALNIFSPGPNSSLELVFTEHADSAYYDVNCPSDRATLTFTCPEPVAGADTSVCGLAADDQRYSDNYIPTDTTVADQPSCAALCQQDSSCITYQIGPNAANDGTSIDCVLLYKSILDLDPIANPHSQFTLYDVDCPLSFETELICGSPSSDLGLSVGNQNALYIGAIATTEGCADKCLNDLACLSYQTSPSSNYNAGPGAINCFLSALSAGNDGASTDDPTSTYLLYDRDCPVPSSSPVPYCGVCVSATCRGARKRSIEYSPISGLTLTNTEQIESLGGGEVNSIQECQALCQSTTGCEGYGIETDMADDGFVYYCDLYVPVGNRGRSTCNFYPESTSAYAYFDINCSTDTLAYDCPVPTLALTPTCGLCVDYSAVEPVQRGTSNKRDAMLSNTGYETLGPVPSIADCQSLCYNTAGCESYAVSLNGDGGGDTYYCDLFEEQNGVTTSVKANATAAAAYFDLQCTSDTFTVDCAVPPPPTCGVCSDYSQGAQDRKRDEPSADTAVQSAGVFFSIIECSSKCVSTTGCEGYAVTANNLGSFDCDLFVSQTGSTTSITTDPNSAAAYFDVACTSDTLFYSCPVPVQMCGTCVHEDCGAQKKRSELLPTHLQDGKNVDSIAACSAYCTDHTNTQSECVSFIYQPNSDGEDRYSCYLNIVVAGDLCSVTEDLTSAIAYFDAGCPADTFAYNCPAPVSPATNSSSSSSSSSPSSTSSSLSSSSTDSTSTSSSFSTSNSPTSSSTSFSLSSSTDISSTSSDSTTSSSPTSSSISSSSSSPSASSSSTSSSFSTFSSSFSSTRSDSSTTSPLSSSSTSTSSSSSSTSSDSSTASPLSSSSTPSSSSSSSTSSDSSTTSPLSSSSTSTSSLSSSTSSDSSTTSLLSSSSTSTSSLSSSASSSSNGSSSVSNNSPSTATSSTADSSTVSATSTSSSSMSTPSSSIYSFTSSSLIATSAPTSYSSASIQSSSSSSTISSMISSPSVILSTTSYPIVSTSSTSQSTTSSSMLPSTTTFSQSLTSILSPSLSSATMPTTSSLPSTSTTSYSTSAASSLLKSSNIFAVSSSSSIYMIIPAPSYILSSSRSASSTTPFTLPTIFSITSSFPQQSSPTSLPAGVTTITEIVTAYTTYCPAATTFFEGSSAYTVTAPTTLTVTNCPCTRTYSITSSIPSDSTSAATVDLTGFTAKSGTVIATSHLTTSSSRAVVTIDIASSSPPEPSTTLSTGTAGAFGSQAIPVPASTLSQGQGQNSLSVTSTTMASSSSATVKASTSTYTGIAVANMPALGWAAVVGLVPAVLL